MQVHGFESQHASLEPSLSVKHDIWPDKECGGGGVKTHESETMADRSISHAT